MLKIEKYYDIRCDDCLMSRSIDIDGGYGMWTGTAEKFRQLLNHEGWKEVKGRNLCPSCFKTMKRIQNTKRSSH